MQGQPVAFVRNLNQHKLIHRFRYRLPNTKVSVCLQIASSIPFEFLFSVLKYKSSRYFLSTQDLPNDSLCNGS